MNRLFLGFLVGFFFPAFMACVAAADPFDILTARFSGTTQSLHGAAYGNGAYVAVGDNGTILYSTDSITWIPQVSGTTNRLNGVKYGTNGFVAVGDSAPGAASTILNSANGFTWVQRTSPVTNKLSCIGYAFGRYVAAGTKGVMVTSTNAINWTAINTGAPYDLNGVDAGSVLTTTHQGIPMFVAVGDSGTIMTSPDGLAWTVRFSGTFSRLAAVSIVLDAYCLTCLDNSLIVAAGDSGTVMTSSDNGLSWTSYSSGTTSNFFAIANDGNGRFGVVGQGGAFFTAPDGINWISEPVISSAGLNGLVYANGNFLAVGDSGAVQAAIAWLPRNAGTTLALEAVIFGGGSFVAVGGSVNDAITNVIIRSVNGKDWTVVHKGTEGLLKGVAYGTNGYVAVGDFGAVLSSSNGLNWSSQTVGSTANWFLGSAYGNGIYVAIGGVPTPPYYGSRTPTVYRSTDGVNWTGSYAISYVIGTTYSGVTFADDIFVAFGGFATSLDGQSWTTNISGLSYGNVKAVASGNGLLVAVGSQPSISPDGTNWIPGISGGHIDNALSFGDQGFVAYGNQFSHNNSISTSSDGTAWVARGIGGDLNGPQFRGATFGNGTYLVVGDSGTIFQSTPTNAQAMPLMSGSSSNHVFKLSAIAQPGYAYRIQVSTNLLNWSDMFTFTSTQAVTSFNDVTATNSPSRFYRLTTP